MKEFTVCFFGHRYLDDLTIEHKLEQWTSSLISEKDFVRFLVGRDGEFDILVASVVRRLKSRLRDDNSVLTWVLPYRTAALMENQDAFCTYYDEIEICESSASVHYKAAFQQRNRSMIDRADLVIFYVNKAQGGAYQSLQYAIKQNKNCINLATL